MPIVCFFNGLYLWMVQSILNSSALFPNYQGVTWHWQHSISFSWKYNTFGIIGEIIDSDQLFTKTLGSILTSLGYVGCQSLLNHERIVKLKLSVSIQQIIATFFVFFIRNIFFLCVLKIIFPLNDIFQL